MSQPQDGGDFFGQVLAPDYAMLEVEAARSDANKAFARDRCVAGKPPAVTPK